MGIEFTINVEGLQEALKKYPDDFYNNIRIANKRLGSKVEEFARKNHRFTTRRGNLVKSIKYFQRANRGDFVRLELKLLDEGKKQGTKYGKYVHEGHGSWGADQFIYNAMESNKDEIFKQWQNAVDKANRKF